MLSDDQISALLLDLKARGLRRTLPERYPGGGLSSPDGSLMLNFASNDYLSLSSTRASRQAAIEATAQWGSGAAASRLVCGTLPIHERLERELAAAKGYPAALVFGSGALANIGVLQTLPERKDVVFADRLIHATMVDGLLLSRAAVLRYRHNDLNHLETLLTREANRRSKETSFLIVTESVFSMDGDSAPLTELCALAERFSAELYVDEAHAFGVFGPCGAGLISELCLTDRIRFAVGTLSKALGGYGGFVSCSAAVRELLINRARSFIYSTALAPPCVGAALASLAYLRENPDCGRELLRRAAFFRSALAAWGLDVGCSVSQIVPVIIGDDRRAVQLSERLKKSGVIAPAIREPTVPRGTARVRFSLTLGHSERDLEEAAAVIARVFKE